VVDGPAEGQAVLDGPWQLLQQDVARPVGADQIGIGHPDDIDAVDGEPVHVAADFLDVLSAHRCLLGRMSGHLRDGGPGGGWRAERGAGRGGGEGPGEDGPGQPRPVV
jgi:hypothetical protein